eukprot:COSAG05_NODE_1316_length_5210_cov_51.150851_6_plen_160_part_00
MTPRGQTPGLREETRSRSIGPIIDIAVGSVDPLAIKLQGYQRIWDLVPHRLGTGVYSIEGSHPQWLTGSTSPAGIYVESSTATASRPRRQQPFGQGDLPSLAVLSYRSYAFAAQVTPASLCDEVYRLQPSGVIYLPTAGSYAEVKGFTLLTTRRTLFLL